MKIIDIRVRRLMNLRFHLTAAAALFLAMPASAQPHYPSRPVRLVVTLAAGGPTDIIGRLLGQKLSEALGQQFVVDNRPGGGGNIGTEIVAKAPPDGHTLLIATSGPMAINVSLFRTLPYDPLRDFAPVVLTTQASHVLVVNPSVATKSVAEFIKLSKTRPGALNYGSNGSGSGNHLAVELFKLMAGIDLTHVPYKGTAPAMTDLLAGQIQLMFASTPAAFPQMQAGKLRGLGISSAKRHPQMPDLPAIAETLASFETAVWQGVAAPAATPRPIVEKLARELLNILHSTDVRERLAAQHFELIAVGPAEFSAHIKSEIATWAKVVKASGARAD